MAGWRRGEDELAVWKDELAVAVTGELENWLVGEEGRIAGLAVKAGKGECLMAGIEKNPGENRLYPTFFLNFASPSLGVSACCGDVNTKK
jgi:hypothetical protein